MAGQSKPRVHLELSSGSLQIQTDEVTYTISVNPGAPLGQIAARSGGESAAPAAEPPAQLPGPAEAPSQVQGGGDFYRQLSEDLYKDIGSLARKLAVSLKDLKVDPGEIDLAGTGQQLESAKDELADIVSMTEQATMNIMDMTDKIQEDVDKAQEFIVAINSAEFVDEAEHQHFWDQINKLMEINSTTTPMWPEVIKQDQEVLALLEEVMTALPGDAPPPPPAAPAPEAPPATETKTEKRIVFPLNDLFQILYELCANDDVKKHIKAIWNKIDEFDAAQVSTTLAAQADDFEMDEGFIMVPLEPLFSALGAATANEGFQGIIGKLNTARDQLFLDQSLPVEVAYEEVSVEVPAEAAAPAPAEPEAEPVDPGPVGDSLTARVAQARDKLTLHLAQIKDKSAPADDFQPDDEIMSRFKASFCFYGDDREAFTRAVKSSQDLVGRVTGALTAITESLSFQDISGQRIQKIVSMISGIQIELLKILVSFQSRVKAETEYQGETEQAKEEMAQQDVDSMLGKLGLGDYDEQVDLQAGPAAGGRLEQESVDDLLAELGF